MYKLIFHFLNTYANTHNERNAEKLDSINNKTVEKE